MPESKIELTETQFLAVSNAASALAPTDYATFLEAVAGELKGKAIGDGSVGCAIRVAQEKFPHPETAHAAHSSWRRKGHHLMKTSRRPRARAAA
jgi:hypothetical protein